MRDPSKSRLWAHIVIAWLLAFLSVCNAQRGPVRGKPIEPPKVDFTHEGKWSHDLSTSPGTKLTPAQKIEILKGPLPAEILQVLIEGGPTKVVEIDRARPNIKVKVTESPRHQAYLRLKAHEIYESYKSNKVPKEQVRVVSLEKDEPATDTEYRGWIPEFARLDRGPLFDRLTSPKEGSAPYWSEVFKGHDGQLVVVVGHIEGGNLVYDSGGLHVKTPVAQLVSEAQLSNVTVFVAGCESGRIFGTGFAEKVNSVAVLEQLGEIFRLQGPEFTMFQFYEGMANRGMGIIVDPLNPGLYTKAQLEDASGASRVEVYGPALLYDISFLSSTTAPKIIIPEEKKIGGTFVWILMMLGCLLLKVYGKDSESEAS